MAKSEESGPHASGGKHAQADRVGGRGRVQALARSRCAGARPRSCPTTSAPWWPGSLEPQVARAREGLARTASGERRRRRCSRKGRARGSTATPPPARTAWRSPGASSTRASATPPAMAAPTPSRPCWPKRRRRGAPWTRCCARSRSPMKSRRASRSPFRSRSSTCIRMPRSPRSARRPRPRSCAATTRRRCWTPSPARRA